MVETGLSKARADHFAKEYTEVFILNERDHSFVFACRNCFYNFEQSV